MGEFQDKVVIITGSGRGIGKAAAIKFAKEGAKTVIVDIIQENAVKTANEINKSGGVALPITADISVEIDVMRMIEKSLNNFKK